MQYRSSRGGLKNRQGASSCVVTVSLDGLPIMSCVTVMPVRLPSGDDTEEVRVPGWDGEALRHLSDAVAEAGGAAGGGG